MSSGAGTLIQTSPNACRKVVALVNSKSGERSSADFLVNNLKASLGHDRLVDLSTCFLDQSKAVDLIRNHAVDGVVIVGGGDGTVSWVMDLVDRIDWATLGGDSHRPYISVIPMGTGNDLSRSLGLGPGFTKEKCCCAVSGCCELKNLEGTLLNNVNNAQIGSMDRWQMVVTSPTGAELDKHPVNNYFSVGFDGSIARKFDTFRKNHPALCQSRVLNKIWYGFLGLDALCGNSKLDTLVNLNVDGKDIPLPPDLKSLVVTNIDSFAGGVKLWKEGSKDDAGKYTVPRLDDNLVEICGMYGSTHMGFMQIKLRSAVKIAQGTNVTITTKEFIPMQWDGEPMWKVNTACMVTITPLSQSKILHHSTALLGRLGKPGMALDEPLVV